MAKSKKELNSIEDILDDDGLDILGGDDADLFKFKHTPKGDERASADFVARRKPCKDFDKYEPTFKEVQQDLAGYIGITPEFMSKIITKVNRM